MKHLFGLFLALMIFSGANAQNQYTWAGTGSYTSTVGFPLFSTGTDTVTPAATLSLTHSLHSHYSTSVGGGDVSSLNYTLNLLKVAGTPTCTVSLYGSANFGRTYGTAPIYSYTVSPSSLTVPATTTYMVNAAKGGNPFSDYLWVVGTSASSTVSVQSDVLIR